MRDDGQIQPAKITHFTEQGYTIKGLIHGGANDGEEVYSYQQLGINNLLCFEPLKKAVKIFRELHSDVPVVEMALGDKNTKGELIVTLGDGKGSSLLQPIIDHPEVTKNWTDNGMIIGKQKVGLIRLDTYFKANMNDTIDNYDCLVLDTQGNEWEVLHGCGELLNKFKYLSVELSQDPVYVGEHKGQDVIDWLAAKGFTQDSELQSHNDVFFIRSDIKAESDKVYHGLA